MFFKYSNLQSGMNTLLGEYANTRNIQRKLNVIKI